MDITPEKILICFGLALFTTILVRFALASKRNTWFKRSKMRSMLTQRGALGEYLSLGYPTTWQGFVVLLGLILILILECWLVLSLPTSWFEF